MDLRGVTEVGRFTAQDALPRPVVLLLEDAHKRYSIELCIERHVPGKGKVTSRCRRIFAGESANQFAELIARANGTAAWRTPR